MLLQASQQGDRKGSPLPRNDEPDPVGWVGATTCSINLLPLPQRGCSTGRPERSTHNLGAHSRDITILADVQKNDMLGTAYHNTSSNILSSGGTQHAVRIMSKSTPTW